jgi:uncharacterized protein YjbI with pentapeptide repeats
MKLSFGISNPFVKPQPATAAEINDARDYAPMGKETDPIIKYKKEALELARAAAALRTEQNHHKPGSPESRPTLEDYRAACITTGEKYNLSNTDWNPKNYAKLDNLDVHGFFLSDPKKQQQYAAATQRQPTQEVHHHQGNDGYDQDGNHHLDADAISLFYDEVSFCGANLDQCYVDPATSFNTQIADAESLDGVQFNRMRGDEKFEFGAGVYKNVVMTDVSCNDAGGLVFATGTQVEGLDISGVEAAITMNPGATVKNMKVNEDTRILNLTVNPDENGRMRALIADSDLREATISMNSKLEGLELKNVQMSGNLSGVEMCGVKLTKVTFDKANLNGLDLRGAEIENLVVDGVVVTLENRDNIIGKDSPYKVQMDDPPKIKASQDYINEMATKKALAATKEVNFKEIIGAWNGMGDKPAEQPVIAKAEPKKDAPAKAQNNTAGIVKAEAGSKKSWNNFVNSDLNAAPKPKTPEEIALEAGQKIAEAWKTPAEEQPVVAKAPSKKQETGFDRSYFTRMSETNGRNIT